MTPCQLTLLKIAWARHLKLKHLGQELIDESARLSNVACRLVGDEEVVNQLKQESSETWLAGNELLQKADGCWREVLSQVGVDLDKIAWRPEDDGVSCEVIPGLVFSHGNPRSRHTA